VVNPTADKQKFEIYADEFKEAITASPSGFTLEAGGRKNVTITINASKFGGDVSQTNLSVVGKPITNGEVEVNTGVKIPITVHATESWYRKLIVPLGIGILLIVAVANYLDQHKQKRTP
jgi:hypothetical protein